MSIKCANERGFDDFLARHQDTESDTSCRRFNNAPEPGRSLLNVGFGGIGSTPINVPLITPLPVVSVSINTAAMCNPKVLLDFTSIIFLPANVSVNLNFTIVKTVGNGCPHAISGIYTFAETTGAGVIESESFTFQYCDCNPVHGNTIYTVQLEPSSSIIPAGTVLSINNAVLSALAVETL